MNTILKDIKNGAKFGFRTSYDANIEIVGRMKPQQYFPLNVIGTIMNIAFVRMLLNRYPRFGKGFAIYSALLWVVDLTMYIDLRRKFKKRHPLLASASWEIDDMFSDIIRSQGM